MAIIWVSLQRTTWDSQLWQGRSIGRYLNWRFTLLYLQYLPDSDRHDAPQLNPPIRDSNLGALPNPEVSNVSSNIIPLSKFQANSNHTWQKPVDNLKFHSHQNKNWMLWFWCIMSTMMCACIHSVLIHSTFTPQIIDTNCNIEAFRVQLIMTSHQGFCQRYLW